MVQVSSEVLSFVDPTWASLPGKGPCLNNQTRFKLHDLAVRVAVERLVPEEIGRTVGCVFFHKI